MEEQGENNDTSSIANDGGGIKLKTQITSHAHLHAISVAHFIRPRFKYLLHLEDLASTKARQRDIRSVLFHAKSHAIYMRTLLRASQCVVKKSNMPQSDEVGQKSFISRFSFECFFICLTCFLNSWIPKFCAYIYK